MSKPPAARTTTLCILFLMPLESSAASPPAQSRPAPVDVGDRKQLFLDDRLIATSEGIRLTMNPPHQDGQCLINADQPWEKNANAILWVYSSVRKENDTIRLWYQLITLKPLNKTDGPHEQDSCIAYAESKDGLHFTRPALKLHTYHGAETNNIVIMNARGASVWLDPKAPPPHRYKTQTKGQQGKLTFHGSPDGIHWTALHAVSIGDCDTQSIIHWDEAVGRYALFTRLWIRLSNREGSYRTHRRLESDDLIRWDRQTTVLQADAEDLATYRSASAQPPIDYYGACVFRYPDPDGLWIMLAQSFWHWYARPDMKTLGPDTMDVRLLAGPDGKTFRPIGRKQPFLRIGPAGSFSSRMVWALPDPVRMGDELWFYYFGSNMDHAGGLDDAAGGTLRTGIARAVLRLDGFASADADYAGGLLTTPPITFKGNALELNLDVGAGGTARVEILDTRDNPIPGFADAQAVPLTGNSVRMPVRWIDKPDLAPLAGKPVKLRFRLRDCKLHAFRFHQ